MGVCSNSVIGMLSIGELCGKNVLHPESEETLTALQMREVRLG